MDYSTSMKIISYNVNGLRSALSKGLAQWLEASRPDVLCLQEIKATPDQVPLEVFENMGYTSYWHPAEKKGYSGTAIFSKLPAQEVILHSGMEEYDREGRILIAEYPQLRLMNVYMPSGSSGEERQDFKFIFMERFYKYIQDMLQRSSKPMVIVGDFNICHQPIDIHNPVSNAKSSGFLPEERAWLQTLFELGFIDTFRHLHPEPHQYTWWSYRMNARERNLGWRIDYQIATQNLESSIVRSAIFSEAHHSDHCPTYLELSV